MKTSVSLHLVIISILFGLESSAATLNWTGFGTNSLWMNRSNWSGNVAPITGDDLNFRAAAVVFSRRTNSNDFPTDTTFGALHFTAELGSTLDYTIFGNSIRLTNGVSQEPSGTFQLDMKGTTTVSNHLTLGASQVFTNALDGALRFAGGVALGANSLFVGVRSITDVTFDAPVTGAGTLDVNPSGSAVLGRVHLASSNAIAGEIVVRGGALLAEHAQALGSASAGPVHVGASGTLRLALANAVFTGSSLAMTGRLEVLGATNSSLSAPILVAGSNAVFAISNNFTLQAAITNSTQLTNIGSGLLRIAPTVIVQGGGLLRNLGVLDVDGIVHNSVQIGAGIQGGSLSGSGQIDSVTVSGFAVIAPGSGTDPTLGLDPLRVGRLSLNSGTTLKMELFPQRPGGGSTNDTIIVTNAPTLGNAALTLIALTNLAPNQQFMILQNLGAAPVTNTFFNLPEGAVLPATNGNFALRISYVGGDGNDVVLTALSNTPPTFATPTNNLTIVEANLLTYTNIVSDLERPPQTMSWSLLTPLSGLNLDPVSGVLTWTPTEAQGPSTNTVLVKVTDSGTPPMSSTGTVIIAVQEFNQPPVPVAVPDTNLLAGNILSLQLVANDPDLPANTLTWQPISLPAGATLASNGQYTYSTGPLEGGIKTNRVRVYDFNPDAVNQNSFTNNLTFLVRVLSRRIVTNTNDSGAGSLRQAILDVNTNPAGGFVEFDIPGSGAQKITPLTQLPDLGGSLSIDGYTQPGARPASPTNAATILIELSGESLTNGSDGLRWFLSGQTIRGLCINRFANGNALDSQCQACSGQVIEGCYIGTDTSGTVARPNFYGIRLDSTANARIGGPDLAQRNIISGNQHDGMSIAQGFDGATTYNLTIQNNMIGTDRTGTNALGNGGKGIVTETGGVGGQGFSGYGCVIADNVIAANGSIGVNFGGTGNVFVRNKIGVGLDGAVPLGNGDIGLALFGNAHRVGTTNSADANIIANNNGPGVLLNDGTNHAVLGNSIFRNSGLGIDLAPAGVTPNDPGDVDVGVNNLQNFPVITTVTPTSGGVTVNGALNSISNTTYRLEFFHSPDFAPNGQPQAKTFLGTTNVSTDAGGNASFSVVLNQTAGGGFITATATDPAGNTSEISAGLAFAAARLDIANLGAQVRVFWVTNLSGYLLQSNSSVALSGGWTNVPGAPGVSGSNYFRDFSPTDAPRYFRLRLP